MHELVQLIYNVLYEYISVSEEERRELIANKDSLITLVQPNIPYMTKRQTLVQEGDGFIQDLLTPVLNSLGFLML